MSFRYDVCIMILLMILTKIEGTAHPCASCVYIRQSTLACVITYAYMYYLNPTMSRLSLLLHESEAKPRTSVNNNDNLRV